MILSHLCIPRRNAHHVRPLRPSVSLPINLFVLPPAHTLSLLCPLLSPRRDNAIFLDLSLLSSPRLYSARPLFQRSVRFLDQRRPISLFRGLASTVEGLRFEDLHSFYSLFPLPFPRSHFPAYSFLLMRRFLPTVRLSPRIPRDPLHSSFIPADSLRGQTRARRSFHRCIYYKKNTGSRKNRMELICPL